MLPSVSLSAKSPCPVSSKTSLNLTNAIFESTKHFKTFSIILKSGFSRQESETVVQLKGLLSSGKLPQGLLAGGRPALQECKFKADHDTDCSTLS